MDYKDIERSIIKKFRKDIWCKFTKAVREYKLIEEMTDRYRRGGQEDEYSFEE